MTVMRYSDQELLELIEEVNTQLPDAYAFYIVDSFGEMRSNDMIRILNLVDHNLLPQMHLGFHSHNNLQLSYSNAITFIDFHTERQLIVDTSIMGMGKGAGNLNTELFAEHLNLYFGKNYQIQPLLEVIDTVINQIHSEFYWGYSVEYYLSSINHCTPSYAGHFFKKHMLSIDQVAELLALLPEEKKISFDKAFADLLYIQYNEKKQQDDAAVIAHLRRQFAGKKVLLLAPGKHLADADDVIREMLMDDTVISVALNNDKAYTTDLVLATKQERFEKAVGRGRQVIVTSNVHREVEAQFEGQIQVLDYKEWTKTEYGINDSAIVIMFNILKAIGVKTVYLAGFDGFSSNINENYMDRNLRRPVTEEQANERNEFFREFLKNMSEKMTITFLTESLYNK
jgi:4-hydroxy 2-oxovalerate aldolase